MSSLSEDAKLVLPAADVLDHYLNQLYTSGLKENKSHHPIRKELDHYQVRICISEVMETIL